MPIPDTSDAEKMRIFEQISYEPDTGLFERRVRSWNSMPGRVLGRAEESGYVRIYLDGRRYLAHRLAWLFVHGEWPKGEIDHINGVRSDNRIANLRDVSETVNKQNQRKAQKNNGTGYLGVFFQKANGRYCAQIKVNKRSKHLGYFDTPEAAALAYVTAKRELHEGCTL